MGDAHLIVDVEVWCEDWRDLNTQFSAAFERYLLGVASRTIALTIAAFLAVLVGLITC